MRSRWCILALVGTLSGLLGCTRFGESAAPVAAGGMQFRPPRRGETVAVEPYFSGRPEENAVLVYRAEPKKELLFRIPVGTNLSSVRNSGDDFYFSKEDDSPDNGLCDLWKVDVRKGMIGKTGLKVGEAFEFSPDGRYLCYAYPSARKFVEIPGASWSPVWLFLPLVRLRELSTGVEVTYDFSGTSLKDMWGVVTEIRPESDRFWIGFNIDSARITLGYVLLSDRQYYAVR